MNKLASKFQNFRLTPSYMISPLVRQVGANEDFPEHVYIYIYNIGILVLESPHSHQPAPVALP